MRRFLKMAVLSTPVLGLGTVGAMTTINDEWDSFFPPASRKIEPDQKERVVILGTGWAALEVLRKLDTATQQVERR